MKKRPNGTRFLNLDFFKNTYLPASVSSDIIEENNREITAQMQSLRLLSLQNFPTITSLLIMGKDPQNWVPGAYIQFVRFEGLGLTDPVKNQQSIYGTLPEQITKIEELLSLNITVSLKLSNTQHIKSPDYPIEALRQLIRNAVIHRNYQSHTPIKVYWFSDRIEIQSPGGPYGELNVNNFGQEGITSYRNPTIAEALKYLGFIERFGFGIPKAKLALKNGGHPELKWDVKENIILVTVRKSR